MSQIERIRDMLADGYAPTEVKETLGASYPTIRKCAQEDDFSPQRPEAPEHPSRLDPCKALIGEMLEEDRRRYRKQRRTAKRVFKRLCAEHGFSGSCSAARRHMKEIRPKGPRGESVRLGWDPGTMQAGFGQADFDYAFGGGRARMHHLPMPFPYSSHEVCEVFADEKDVCVCQGLKDRFERIGGVPPVIVLDNATEAGRRRRDVIVGSDLFRRLRLHCGFTARFCNPSAGKEKGSVEGKVGCTRRSFFVPVPEVDGLQDYSRGLAETLDAHSEERLRYEKGLGWAALFQVGKARLPPLPKKPFDVVKRASRTTDGYGRITLGGRHRHLASPSLACVSLTVGARAFTVEIDAPDGTPLRACRRRSGKLSTSDEDPPALLGPLSMKARAFAQPSVRAVRRGCEGRLRLHGDRRAERPGQGDLEARTSLWHGDRRPGVLRGAAGHRRDAPRRCRDVLRRDPRARRRSQGGARAGHQARRLRRLHAQGRRPGRPGCRRRLMRATRG
ncbi:IS21 family transposase [Olsenella uli]|uniref:IS21 family transposase n=1 Tax=Olsenella uli TaxID=133926 RepID=UPI003D7B51B5